MVVVCIAAGGTGSRAGGEIPKQFQLLCGEPVLAHTFRALAPFADRIIIGVSPQWREHAVNIINNKGIIWAEAGTHRNATLYNCSQAVKEKNALFLTHDAARPLIDPKIITENLRIARDNPACAVGTAVPATDTILHAKSERLLAIPPRPQMYQAQTPQTFLLGLFEKVYHEAGEKAAQATDALALFHRAGIPVLLSPGNPRNIKITYPHDLLFAESMMGCRPASSLAGDKNQS